MAMQDFGVDAPLHQRTLPRLLSIVSPVYGCTSCLEDLVERLLHAVEDQCEAAEIILVDDAGPDDAWPRILELAARHASVRGLRLSRNFGQHYAIAAGIEHARGDVIALLDCDLQDLPEELPRLLEESRNGHDIVFASREQRQDGLGKRLSSRAFSAVLAYLTGVRQDHTTANFGVFSRRAIDLVNRMPERDRCFPLMVKWTGLPMTTVPVQHAPRTSGRSGYSFRKLVNLAIDIVLSYSDKPLRLVVQTGLWFSAGALLIVVISIYRYSIGDVAVAGFTSIIASIWLLGGVVTFCVGIIGLYLGRLFNSSKQRPYYVIVDRTADPGEPA